MKQVWQTDDGAVFDDMLVAQNWERQIGAIQELADFLKREAYRMDDGDARNTASVILAHYNVSKK